MASRHSVRALGDAFCGLSLSSSRSFQTTVMPACRIASMRSLATASSTSAAPSSFSSTTSSSSSSPSSASSPFVSITQRRVPVTVFAFPSLEPRALEMWSAQHLQLPLRRDLLHLAVVYEGDNTRQGTASSKTRYDVAGSHRKLRPQKGSGRARLGSRQSPLLRGGGKVFGPHPRDFGTDLNRKVYDRAWRTALSYRYSRGELIVCEDGLELPLPDAFLAVAGAGSSESPSLDRVLEDGFVRRYVRALLNGTATSRKAANSPDAIGSIGQAWGRAGGRTTFITTDRRPNLFTSLDIAGEDGRALQVADVDVKDLLETGRIVIERAALREIIERHQSDIAPRLFFNGVRKPGPPLGQILVA